VIRDEGNKRCGGTTALVDRQSGRIHLLIEVAGSRFYQYTSDDDGKTWAEHQELTPIFKAFRTRFGWTRLSTGSGHGIVLKRRKHNGRFIIPFWCTKDEMIFRSGLIYSDDRGETWRAGGLSDPSMQSNETTIYEGVDGLLHFNMRAGGVQRKKDRSPHRVTATSEDGGETWSASQYDDVLISPQCHASTLRYTWPEEGRSRVLFSNPADAEERIRMTVRLSYDDGETWPRKRMIFGGPSAYSDLARLKDGRIGLLWEGGDEDKYARLMFAAFKLSWLTKGEEER
jgi:sialidase-1